MPTSAPTSAPQAANGPPPQLDSFLALVTASLEQASFVKLVLAKYVGPEAQLNQVVVRQVTLRNVACLSLVYRYQTRDITKNLPVREGIGAIRGLLGEAFRNAHLRTTVQDTQLTITQRGRCTLHSSAIAPHEAPPQEHNREKQRFIEQDRPFLVALGVTNPQHQVVAAMSRKWKQINRFVEVFSHAMASSTLAQAQRMQVVDFGSGKGYLTFAIHDHLRHGLGIDARVTGVELKPDMVRLANETAARLGLQGLSFEQGDIAAFAPRPVDVMIALHACDVATDHAIHKGIRAGAAIVMCSPCCHKQIRAQLLSPHPLRPILQHGIHMAQEAEMVTDGLRALLLESRGYQTQVFEFVSLEHTEKNKMILAVKRDRPSPADEVLAQIDEIKRFYGIREQCLETLLNADG